MTIAHGIVDALTGDNQEHPELPLDPSIDVPASLVAQLASKVVRDYMDSREHGKAIYDHAVHDHGIMYSDYFQGVSTVHTRWEDVYTGAGENGYEALDEALDDAASDGWDVRSIKNDFDPESPDNVQNSIRDNNPDMEDDDDAADGVYYYVSIFVRGVPSGMDESRKPSAGSDMLKNLGKVAIDAGKKQIQIGSLFRGTSSSSDFIDGCLDALAWLDKAQLNSIKTHYSDELAMAKLIDQGEDIPPNDQEAVDSFAYETLDRIMQGYCIPITFFGPHPGSGEDIGCWPDYDRLNAAEKYEDDDSLVVLEQGSPAAQAIMAGTPETDRDYAAWKCGDGDEWEVWDAKRGKLIWHY